MIRRVFKSQVYSSALCLVSIEAMVATGNLWSLDVMVPLWWLGKLMLKSSSVNASRHKSFGLDVSATYGCLHQ